MEKITLNEYLKQGSVVENLKNFVGVTPENTVGLMTPERLAAVAGESIPIASPNTNGLQDKRFAESIIFTINKKSIRVHHANKDLSFGFILFISGGGSVKGDCAIYICGSTYTGGKPDSCYIYGNIPQSMYLGYESQSDGSLDIYLYTDGIFGSYRVLKKSIHESSNVAMMEADGVDVSSIIKVEIKR